MAKQNLVLLNAKVETEPVIERNEETGEYQYGMCIMDVVRGKRAVGDNKQYIKHDGPVIVSKDEIITKVWGYDSDAGSNNVEAYISFLRRKLNFINSDTEIK